jgi:LmbE family N-acetylglucosaminyl deacetylase
MMTDKVDVLVIAPHADDAEFGAGGTIAGWTRQGKKVAYVICTNGDKGTGDMSIKPADLAVTREAEQQAAAKVLGVREVVFLRYPDQALEDTAEFRKSLVRQIRLFKPDIVMSTDPYRRYMWHRDHRICGQVVLDALFPYARDHLAYPDLLKEGILPHKTKQAMLWASEDINCRFDITATFETKLAALRCHKSQLGEELAPELIGWITKRATDYAEGQPYKLAEAFHCVDYEYPIVTKPREDLQSGGK